MLNVVINLFVTHFHLAYNRQNLDRFQVSNSNLPILHPLHSDNTLRLEIFQRDCYRRTAHTQCRHLPTIDRCYLGIGT